MGNLKKKNEVKSVRGNSNSARVYQLSF